MDVAIESLQRAGNVANLAISFANLAVFFNQIQQHEIAATLHGAGVHHGDISWVDSFRETVNDLHSVLGQDLFDRCVASGAAMEPAEAVRHARDQIQLAHRELPPDRLKVGRAR